MDITIFFSELKEILSEKTNNKVDIDLCFVQRDTIKISYKPIPFLPAVGINIKIDYMDNSKICLSYDAGNAIDMVIKGLVAFLDKNIPKDIVELDTNNQSVSIHLNSIEQLQKPLEMMEIQDVWFEDNAVCAKIKLMV